MRRYVNEDYQPESIFVEDRYEACLKNVADNAVVDDGEFYDDEYDVRDAGIHDEY
jgi:hypothetical protein